MDNLKEFGKWEWQGQNVNHHGKCKWICLGSDNPQTRYSSCRKILKHIKDKKVHCKMLPLDRWLPTVSIMGIYDTFMDCALKSSWISFCIVISPSVNCLLLIHVRKNSMDNNLWWHFRNMFKWILQIFLEGFSTLGHSNWRAR